MPALLDTRRITAALVAVAMSAALIAFALITSDTLRTQLQAGARASVGNADVVVLPGRHEEHLSEDTAQKITAAPEIEKVRPYIEGLTYIDNPGTANDSHTFVLDVPELTGDTRLEAGRLPATGGEIAVSPSFVQRQSVEVGSAVAFTDGETTTGSRSTATIVGIIKPGAELTRRNPEDSFVFATADERSALGVSEAPAVLYVTGREGTSTDDLLDSVTKAAGDAKVYTADEIVAMRAESNGGSSASTTLQLLVILGPVCAIVAAIIIASTFTALVARQTRTTGLLRCVGASRAQVMGAVLRTAALTGLLGSVIGAAAGTGAAALLIRSGTINGLEPRHLTITWTALALAVGISVLVTLVAVLRPARQAARVSPLIALTGQVADDRALGRRRLAAVIGGAVIAAGGASILILAMNLRILQYTVAGAVILLLGVLAALPLIVVGAARLLGRLAGAERAPILHLAARNLARSPGRAAAITAALLVSVGVATTMVVGVASINASMDAYLNSRAPIDIRIEGMTAGYDTASLTAQIQGINGIQTTALVPELTVQAAPDGADSQELTVNVVDEQAVSPVIRSRVGLEGLDDNTLIIGGLYDIPDGTMVTLTGPAGTTALTAHVQEGGFGPVITPATARQLNGDAPTDTGMWVRVSGDGSGPAPAAGVRESLRGSGLIVSSSSDGRATFTQVVNRVITVIGTVLGLTMLITLSGLANTTDINVLERTREIGVLRATGAQRREIRRLVIAEALFTAVLGGLIGIALGCALGIASSEALLNTDSGNFAVISIPWPALAGILLAAGGIGVLASLRPAGRAAAVAPVTALAAD